MKTVKLIYSRLCILALIIGAVFLLFIPLLGIVSSITNVIGIISLVSASAIKHFLLCCPYCGYSLGFPKWYPTNHTCINCRNKIEWK